MNGSQIGVLEHPDQVPSETPVATVQLQMFKGTTQKGLQVHGVGMDVATLRISQSLTLYKLSSIEDF